MTSQIKGVILQEMELDPILLERYLERALSTYDSKYHNRPHYISCKCPFCGDSKIKRKTRGYILKGDAKHDYVWTYTCHNGDCEIKDDAISAENFLKYKFPNIYDEYKREKFNNFIYNRPNKPSETIVIENTYNEHDDLKFFIHILKGVTPVFEKAIKYCVGRKIPENVWKKFYVAVGGKYQGRLIIPFYNRDDKIYYYQARTLIGSEPKYLNRNGEKGFYGIDLLDRSKPVIIQEGPFDSLFVENCTAALGLDFDKIEKDLPGVKKYYLLDNDKDGKKMSKKLLKNGEYVFLWNYFLKDLELSGEKIKDVNDVVMKTGKEFFTFSELEKYFTNDVYKELLI